MNVFMKEMEQFILTKKWTYALCLMSLHYLVLLCLCMYFSLSEIFDSRDFIFDSVTLWNKIPIIKKQTKNPLGRKAPYVVANCRNTNTVLHRCAQPSFVSVERGPHECVRVGKCLLKCGKWCEFDSFSLSYDDGWRGVTEELNRLSTTLGRTR